LLPDFLSTSGATAPRFETFGGTRCLTLDLTE
jgi:hypothetical protein